MKNKIAKKKKKNILISKNNGQLRQEIIALLSRLTKIPAKDIYDGILIREELCIDSLLTLEIIATIKNKYEVELDENKMLDISTVGQFITFVEKAINAK